MPWSYLNCSFVPNSQQPTKIGQPSRYDSCLFHLMLSDNFTSTQQISSESYSSYRKERKKETFHEMITRERIRTICTADRYGAFQEDHKIQYTAMHKDKNQHKMEQNSEQFERNRF